MSDHEHDWQPLHGEVAQYTCACGATGWRKRGPIVQHSKRKQKAARWSARPLTSGNGGRVGPLPSLDQTEKRTK